MSHRHCNRPQRRWSNASVAETTALTIHSARRSIADAITFSINAVLASALAEHSPFERECVLEDEPWEYMGDQGQAHGSYISVAGSNEMVAVAAAAADAVVEAILPSHLGA
jgi:hypothetical protein